MDKLRMQTANKADENFKKLAAMFPNAVTETINENGEVVRAIDKDVLMQEISCKVVDGNEERYQFTWPDKKKSVLLANAPINKTLRPVREDETVPTGADSEGKPYCSTGSVDFDTTENLYIEGDNLEVLKLLQETYLGKIKMIYIDPPYNTGNDFVYNDEFGIRNEEWNGISGNYDADGNQIVGALEKNTEANGRFHTDWLNMIYPRLKLAKDLLTEDGVVFVSIDANESHNLRKICEEVFGSSNFVSEIIIQNNPRGRQSDRFIATAHEYLLCFCKNSMSCVLNGLPLSEEQKAEYSFSDEKGAYRLLGLRQRGVASLREDRPDMFFPIYVNPKTQEVSLEIHNDWCEVIPKKSDGREGRWMWGKEKCKVDSARLVARLIERRGEYDIFVKDYLDREDGARTRKFKSIWDDKALNNQVGTQEVKALLKGDIMSFPKSKAFIQMVCQLGGTPDAIVMDFFSGSATTAHAVMQLNAEDGGHRKFIMVQLPEKCDEKSEAYKAGYKTICEIGKERIRRAGKKIREENTDNSSLLTPNSKLDTGFRVLKCDTSNMKDVYYNPAEYEVNMFSRLEDNIKADRTPEDLLFQVMLDLGILLSSKIQVRSVKVGMRSYSYFDVEDGYLIACFDKNIDEEVITTIAKQKPYYFVMRDSSMASDSVATNFDQIFATYSPETVRKVL